MEQELKALLDRLHNAGTLLENSPYAHLLKQDAIALYHDTANAIGHIAASLKELTAIVKPGPTPTPVNTTGA